MLDVKGNLYPFEDDTLVLEIPRYQQSIVERFWNLYWTGDMLFLRELEVESLNPWWKYVMRKIEKQLKGHDKYGYQGEKAMDEVLAKVVYRCAGADNVFMKKCNTNNIQI